MTIRSLFDVFGTMSQKSRVRALVTMFLVSLLWSFFMACSSPVRPLPIRWHECERRLSSPPPPRHITSLATAFRRSLIEPVDELLSLRAAGPLDVNELDFVVDSSWYRNPSGGPARIYGYRGFSSRPEAFAAVPSLLGPWRVLAAGRRDDRLWLAVRDGRRRFFLLRFDAPGRDGLATASELVATRILGGLGYFVPIRSMVLFSPGRLVWPADLAWCHGQRVPLTVSSLSEFAVGTVRCPFPGRLAAKRAFGLVSRSVEGTVRALSTRLVAGDDLGPFPLSGVRKGDPNDRIAHERRRSLRALRLIASWLDLPDLGEETGRDIYDQGRIRHYLWFLEGGLGVSPSGLPRTIPKGRRPKAGTWPGWPRPSLSWRPLLRHPGLAAAGPADLFWAARTLSVWSSDRLRSLVAQAYLPNQLAQSLLSRLVGAKKRAVRLGLNSACPAGDFHVRGIDRGRIGLCFKDLSKDVGENGPFLVQWAGRKQRLVGSLQNMCVTLPRSGGKWLSVRLWDRRHRRADVWLRRGQAAAWKVASIRRY